LTKAYKLKLLSSSGGRIVEDKEAEWGISLMSRYGYTVEQVRPLVAEMISTYLNTIMSNREFEVLWFDQFMNYVGPPRPIGERSIAIKLAFWDANFDRYFYPCVAEVRFTYGKVNYYYADPETQKLLPPITETLDELYSHLHEEDQSCLSTLPTNF